jgi:hypothetical protein
VNYHFIGVPLYRVLFAIQPFLYPIFGIVTLAWLALNWRRAPALAKLLGGAFLMTVALHVVGFHLLGLLYPLDRTGIFFVPLAFGAIALMASLPAENTVWLRRVQIGALASVSIFNLSCLRLNYFEEWGFDQDTDKIYEVLSCLHDRNQVRRVASEWPFLGAMNFYRRTSHGPTIDRVIDVSEYTAETEAFVVDATFKPEIVAKRELTSLWKSTRTGAQIAVPPEQMERLKGSVCFQ